MKSQNTIIMNIITKLFYLVKLSLEKLCSSILKRRNKKSSDYNAIKHPFKSKLVVGTAVGHGFKYSSFNPYQTTINNTPNYHEILSQIKTAKIDYTVLLLKLREKTITKEEDDKLQALDKFLKDLVFTTKQL